MKKRTRMFFLLSEQKLKHMLYILTYTRRWIKKSIFLHNFFLKSPIYVALNTLNKRVVKKTTSKTCKKRKTKNIGRKGGSWGWFWVLQGGWTTSK